MAAGNWATIMETLRAQESGRRSPTDIVAQPAASSQVVAKWFDDSEALVSKLPAERMAATNVGPSSADAAGLGPVSQPPLHKIGRPAVAGSVATTGRNT